ncbi:MAG: SDR family oxidoreductase [Rubinisphaera brasiliensis]|uniref:Short-chain dehydrogenase/reductase SDR n=1 Tax=Rubinisphaera brasiliensis (strain ATCC 49424 / DSM 5305 / JCM 21570 / IAM 15109 / NBRC 103401 / IFAM 1448) TaxID=756272 RepID=F0SPT1_RUBBR|nr:SDR family oxidoreductase [Rubinisphaera brasiliensis]ADY59040.1 short-chain dehydrogenase/reductase SDR [Rubinisphaera brasiliensis DSM 5305]MBR9801849.1 SDR family oxidoreductase [bacterium]
MNTSSVHKPVALITGSGADRVGQAIANDLASQGYRIALHYRTSQEEAEQALEELRQQNVECEAFQADLTVEDDVNRMFAEQHKRFGRLDVLVMTASIYSPCKLEDITLEEIQKNFAINTAASFLCARAAGLQMVKQEQGGNIILFGDSAIEQPYLNHAAYFLSKGALPTLTRTLALELSVRNPNVRVNCLHPGPILFPPGASEEEKQQLIESTLVHNADVPDQVTHAVRFLIENTFITGAGLPLDGGRNLALSRDVVRNAE